MVFAYLGLAALLYGTIGQSRVRTTAAAIENQLSE